jgi:hypothetical protein
MNSQLKTKLPGVIATFVGLLIIGSGAAQEEPPPAFLPGVKKLLVSNIDLRRFVSDPKSISAREKRQLCLVQRRPLSKNAMQREWEVGTGKPLHEILKAEHLEKSMYQIRVFKQNAIRQQRFDGKDEKHFLQTIVEPGDIVAAIPYLPF